MKVFGIARRQRLALLLKASAIVSICLVWGVPQVCAEVTKFELPGDYSDFAFHAETADFIAISAETDEAFLFRDAQMRKEPAARLRVGSTPVSACFKQFGDQSVYAVVCSQDSHMYLIDAEKFELLKKIELAQAGVSNVTCSRNPSDPFIYYNYGGGHDSEAGVVSLRDLKNHGLAFDDSMDCAISADGSIAYRRGPWSPSGFESLIRTNDLTDTKPTFARLFYDHNSTSQYIPDPFGRYTAASKSIYTASLEKREAELDFFPRVFFRTHPVVVGISSADRFPREPAGELVLRAASYNTFANVGDQVKVALGKPKDEGELPRGGPRHGDFKRVAKKSRFIADEKRDRLIYASRGEVIYIPLAEFNLPGEPFLLAELEGPDQLVIGERHQLKLLPKDPRIKLEFEDSPEGMEIAGNTMTWTPTADQIGRSKLAVTFKHTDIQRTVQYDLDVVFPSVSLPFSPSAVAVDASGKHALIWEGQTLDRFGRPSGASNLPIRIALINLATGETTAQRKLAEHIGHAVVTETQVVLQTASSTPKCEVLKLADLERAKAIVASAPIQKIHALGKLLVLETQSGAEVYHAETYEKLRTFGPSNQTVHSIHQRNNTAQSMVKEEGLFSDGILYDVSLRPKLFVAPKNLPELPGADVKLRQASYLTSKGGSPVNNVRYSPSRNGQVRLATLPLSGGKVNVALDQNTQRIQVPGSTHTSRTQLELKLTASGAIDGQQVVARELLHAQVSPAHRPILQVADRDALVVHGSQLYRWRVQGENAEAGSGAEDKITLARRQSAFALTGTGKTTLKHAATGGERPLKFALLTPYEDAVSIDTATGTVTIDEKLIMAEAAKTLENDIRRSNRGESYVDTLRTKAVPMIQAATTVLGRKPKGAPVAIPVRIDVSDKNLASDSIQYFLVAEVPSSSLMAKLKALDEERKEKVAEAQAAREAAREAAQAARDSGEQPLVHTPADGGDMSRRLEALEQRVDLLTRQLNLVLKKLDEQ